MTGAMIVAVMPAILSVAACRRGEEQRSTPVERSEASVLGNQVKPGLLQGYNVLFITLDTVRRDHLGCYGFDGAETPTIDRLAKRGIIFDHAITASPSTLPSHSTMMTGLELPSHGVRTNGHFKLGDEFTTMAEVLQGQGYRTAAFTGTFVLHRKFGLGQGFDLYDDWNPGKKEPGDRSRRGKIPSP